MKKLQISQVTIVGLGGVGSATVEALARAGIGNFKLIDYDRVNITNLNRQLIALLSSIGRLKTEVTRDRILDINPDAKVEIFSEFLCLENRLEILKRSGYIVDAIDSLGPKMGMIRDLCSIDKPFISVLGAGNRIDPTSIKIVSIWETTGCPMAKRLKKLLRRYDVTNDFPVVFSSEVPISIDTYPPLLDATDRNIRPDSLPKTIVGSISYMPVIMGMMAAGKVVKDLIK
jgi:tRNA A37 threonylcarbamoyladenosine dehydratase